MLAPPAILGSNRSFTGRRGRRPLRPRNRSKTFYGKGLASVQNRRGRRPRRPVNEIFRLIKWREAKRLPYTIWCPHPTDKSKFEKTVVLWRSFIKKLSLAIYYEEIFRVCPLLTQKLTRNTYFGAPF